MPPLRQYLTVSVRHTNDGSYGWNDETKVAIDKRNRRAAEELVEAPHVLSLVYCGLNNKLLSHIAHTAVLN